MPHRQSLTSAPRSEVPIPPRAAEATLRESSEASAAALNGSGALIEWPMQSAESGRQIVQTSVEITSRGLREVLQQVGRSFSLSGDSHDLLHRQFRQSAEASGRCSVIVVEALQDYTFRCAEAGYRQGLRNLDTMSRVARAKTAQEFATLAAELTRENLEHMTEDTRAIFATAIRAADEAAEALSGARQAAT